MSSQIESGPPNPNPNANAGSDPRDVFLTAAEVHQRYKLGRNRGYEYISRELAEIAVAPGRWRLADLHAFEDWTLARKLAARAARSAPPRPSVGPGPSTPRSVRRTRPSDPGSER